MIGVCVWRRSPRASTCVDHARDPEAAGARFRELFGSAARAGREQVDAGVAEELETGSFPAVDPDTGEFEAIGRETGEFEALQSED